jgi:hypothetical protein
MNSKTFNEILIKTLTASERTLGVKASEYATSGDRFHNFKRAAARLGCTPEQALIGMEAKHDTSVLDIVSATSNIADDPSTNGAHKVLTSAQRAAIKARIDEKIGDSINYRILLKGLLYERYNLC